MNKKNKRILIFSEKLSFPIDEGIKKTAWSILAELSKISQVLGLSREGTDSESPPLRIIRSNKLLLDKNVRKIVRSFSPDTILYIPTSSGTVASFLRMWVLRSYAKAATAVLLLLQPKPLSSWKSKLAYIFKPDKVISPSPYVLTHMKRLAIPAEFIPLGVDPDVFRPLGDKSDRSRLRNKYNLPKDKFIILHVGHINWGRNLEALLPLQRDDTQVVLVSSTSTPHNAPREAALTQKLKKNGVLIFDEYVESIQEFYQLSDVYVFPVIKDIGSIGIPLSILEARSCGLPVISTPFGGVQEIFSDKDDAINFLAPERFADRMELLKKDRGSDRPESFNSQEIFLKSLKDHMDISS